MPLREPQERHAQICIGHLLPAPRPPEVRREPEVARTEPPLKPPFFEPELLDVDEAAVGALVEPVVKAGRNHRRAIGRDEQSADSKRGDEVGTPDWCARHQAPPSGDTLDPLASAGADSVTADCPLPELDASSASSSRIYDFV